MSTVTGVKSDIANPSLAAEGKKRIEWAERNMPVLSQIKSRFAKEKPFNGVRISACMHVTTETANLMLALKAGGAEIALCASNPLSTQDETAAALVHEYGISVYAKNAVDRDGFYKHINSALDIKPQIVFDDGCDLVNVIHTSRTELIDGVLAGCEETTTGVIRLSQMAKDGALKFPMIAVNDTDTKHMFDNRYGTGQSTFDAIFRSTNTLVAGKIVVVAGFGYLSLNHCVVFELQNSSHVSTNFKTLFTSVNGIFNTRATSLTTPLSLNDKNVAMDATCRYCLTR